MIFELAPPKYYTTPSCYTISDCYRHTSETPNTVRPHGRIQRGKAGGPDLPPPPPRNHKAIGCLSNTGPDPLKNHKATKPALTVRSSSACQRNSIPFKWLFAFWPALSGNWILSTPPPPLQLKKDVVRVGPPLTKLSGSAHGPRVTPFYMLSPSARVW